MCRRLLLQRKRHHSGGHRKKAGRVVDAVNWLQRRRAQHRVSDAVAGRDASHASTLRRWVREVAFNDVVTPLIQQAKGKAGCGEEVRFFVGL